MTKRPRTLTAAFVRTVGRPGVYGDGRGGRGLSLRVHRTASGRITKTWRQRVRIDGRLTSIGLGPYPEVTLAEARQKALDNSRGVRLGQNPRGDVATVRHSLATLARMSPTCATMDQTTLLPRRIRMRITTVGWRIRTRVRAGRRNTPGKQVANGLPHTEG